MTRLSRRPLLGGLAAAATIGLARPARAAGTVSAAIYPGAWEDAFRSLVAPALKARHDVTLEMQPLFAVDQIAKARATRGVAAFDCFVLDPGPRITAMDGRLFAPFDPSKLSNLSKLPAGFADAQGVTCAAQVVGIAYNPKKVPPPTAWTDLFKEPWVSRLGLTGFQTTFGTVSIIEMAKQFGGSETDVEPFFTEIRKVLPKIATIGAPAAMPGLFQQGQCDVMYTNTQAVATLKSRGVDIEFAKPASGAVAFFTTLHIARNSTNLDNAYKYIDTVISAEIQTALMGPPNNFIPVNSDVVLTPDLPMKTLAEMAAFVRHDWAKINPLRAGWIERFNREVAK
jgi:putative spermidine/putrescine transport system substrate-binding protein